MPGENTPALSNREEMECRLQAYEESIETDELHSDELHSDEPHSEELHSEEPHSDELHSDELHPDDDLDLDREFDDMEFEMDEETARRVEELQDRIRVAQEESDYFRDIILQAVELGGQLPPLLLPLDLGDPPPYYPTPTPDILAAASASSAAGGVNSGDMFQNPLLSRATLDRARVPRYSSSAHADISTLSDPDSSNSTSESAELCND